jgi:predicted nucleic acid-binding protein
LTNKLFVDTSGWLALANRSDVLHQEASTIYNDRFGDGWKFVTHAGVMLEVGNGLALARFRHLAVLMKSIIDASARIETIPLTEMLYESGWQMYSNLRDKDWGLVDCISFIVMRDRGLAEALTADKHFEQAGFAKLL